MLTWFHLHRIVIHFVFFTFYCHKNIPSLRFQNLGGCIFKMGVDFMEELIIFKKLFYGGEKMDKWMKKHDHVHTWTSLRKNQYNSYDNKHSTKTCVRMIWNISDCRKRKMLSLCTVSFIHQKNSTNCKFFHFPCCYRDLVLVHSHCHWTFYQ